LYSSVNSGKSSQPYGQGDHLVGKSGKVGELKMSYENFAELSKSRPMVVSFTHRWL